MRKSLTAAHCVFSESRRQTPFIYASLMKGEIFNLSNLLSTKLIIINTADHVALCLRGSSLQVIVVRLIICDGFFMRINGTEW